MQYIRSTIYIPLIMMVDKINIVKCWVDASYEIHTDYRSHIGATISLGWVSVYIMSKRKNLNSRILTEAELIGAEDMIPGFIWSRYFIEVKWFNVEETVM